MPMIHRLELKENKELIARDAFASESLKVFVEKNV